MTGSRSLVGFSRADVHASVTWESARSSVVVVGELDLMFEESGATITTMLADQRLPVAVDLSGVTLFCAAGVGWLTTLYGAVDAEVLVVAASVPVRRVLDICGVPLQSAARQGSVRRSAMCLN